LKSGDLALRGVYVDTGLVLRSGEEPNEYLAKDLMKQLGEQKLPVMVPLAGLDLRLDEDASYGLAFNVRDGAEIVYDEILNAECGRFDSKEINEKTGLPKKLGGDERGFWTRSSGLSGFFLGRSSNLNSYFRNLDNSNDYGRVVVADA